MILSKNKSSRGAIAGTPEGVAWQVIPAPEKRVVDTNARRLRHSFEVRQMVYPDQQGAHHCTTQLCGRQGKKVRCSKHTRP